MLLTSLAFTTVTVPALQLGQAVQTGKGGGTSVVPRVHKRGAGDAADVKVSRERPSSSSWREVLTKRLGYRRGGPVRIVVARAKYKTVDDSGNSEIQVAPKPKELYQRGLLAPSLGFSGFIQADAHVVYDALFRGDAREDADEDPPTEVGCWSHARRKLWEAATAAKEPLAREGLLRIAKLFELDEKWRKLPPSKRLQLRQGVAKPLVGAFFARVHEHYEAFENTRGLLRSAL